MKQSSNENAANRLSYVGDVFNLGERAFKDDVLARMPQQWADLHRKGYVHIHDLGAHGKTYNCLTFNSARSFPYHKFEGLTNEAKIVRAFGYFRTLLTDLGNEQSGGMAFANFDNELSEILQRLGIADTPANWQLIAACIGEFIVWCNDTHTRMGQTSYYVTLNLGLARDVYARKVALAVIDEFQRSGETVFKPNIVFKVVKGVNRMPSDPNFDLFERALACTAKKMIPTYLLCDCAEDKDVNPEVLSVMGCRTRVVDDVFGERGAVGRGNVCNVSVNLPRLALETVAEGAENPIADFTRRWKGVAATTAEILLDRYQKTVAQSRSDFPVNSREQLWCVPFDEPREVFLHGTLSIGFIGLSEAFEILTGKRFYTDGEVYEAALGFVETMRAYCDGLRDRYNCNFSLLATSGELISGRFLEIDRKQFQPNVDVFSKGFYTNSFHVNVDSGVTAREKLRKEGPFHTFCNGGSISYVELAESPIGNAEGLRELVEEGIASGVRYLGVNFPKDVCNDCGASGVFDGCPVCGSKEITRIRRVSGYLEILDGFTYGKKNEAKTRTEN